MGTAQWGSLPKSVGLAVAAFTMHGLLLLFDLLVFGSAFAGSGAGDRLWPVLRILVVALLIWSLLQRAAQPWFVGALACTAFLIRDLVRLRQIFAGPALESAQRQLTAGLLVSLIVAIGASWSPSANRPSRGPAA